MSLRAQAQLSVRTFCTWRRLKLYVPLGLFVVFVAAEVYVLDRMGALEPLLHELAGYGTLLLTFFMLIVAIGVTLFWRLEATYQEMHERFDELVSVLSGERLQQELQNCNVGCGTKAAKDVCSVM